MSSNISGSLSAGAQLLTNGQLLLPGPSQSDVGSATPDQGVKKAAAPAPLQTSSVISGSITSPDGDTVELSAEALQMLQQMGSPDPVPSHSAHAFSAATAYESIDYFG